MGFSAFPDGGRFEALYGAGPGDETPVAVQVRGAKASVGVASLAAVPGYESGKGPGRGAEPRRAGGRAEVTVFPSRSPGCWCAEGWPRGLRRGLRSRGDRDDWQSSPGAQESALPLQPPPSPLGAHLLPDAFCRTGCNMAAATAASAPGS